MTIPHGDNSTQHVKIIYAITQSINKFEFKFIYIRIADHKFKVQLEHRH